MGHDERPPDTEASYRFLHSTAEELVQLQPEELLQAVLEERTLLQVIIGILDASSQLAFWANVDSILGTRGNVLVEAVNEADLAINRLEAQNQLPRPTRVTASHGRKGSDQLPVAPGFDYIRK